MPVELIRSEALTSDVPYAYAAVVHEGSLVFTAGACPLDAEGEVAALGDVAGQARLAMHNLEQALAATGATLADVAKSTVYVVATDREDLVAAWREVRAAFGEHDAPSTLLAVPLLGYEGQLVEVEAVAAVIHKH